MMRKIAASFFFLGVLTIALLEPPAWPQEKHWLIGLWKGEITDFKGAGGPTRTLNVVEVGADGTVQAAWGTVAAPKVGSAKVEVNGDIVTITPTPNTRAELKRAGDRLEGTFTAANGRSYPFQLSRVVAHRFAGQVQAKGRDCFARVTDMQVEQIGESVRGHLESPNGAARFSGKMDGASFEAKRTSSRNEAQTITGTITGDEMATTFAAPGCTFTGTLKRQP